MDKIAKLSQAVSRAVYDFYHNYYEDETCWVAGFETSVFPGTNINYNQKPKSFHGYREENEKCFIKDETGEEFVLNIGTRRYCHEVGAFTTKEEAVEYYNDKVRNSARYAKDEMDEYLEKANAFIQNIYSEVVDEEGA